MTHEFFIWAMNMCDTCAYYYVTGGVYMQYCLY